MKTVIFDKKEAIKWAILDGLCIGLAVGVNSYMSQKLTSVKTAVKSLDLENK